jgi:hypothetical protein
MKLTLFRREGCHLCEHAEEALRGAGVEAWDEVWLEWSGPLAHRYGARIPVVRREDTGAELEWPFDTWTVRQFLRSSPSPAPPGRVGEG